MEFWLSCDIDWETRADKARDEIEPKLERAFKKRSYGAGIESIDIIFMCRNPRYRFRQRRKWTPSERNFYTDIMLPHQEMIDADEKSRPLIVADALASQLPKMIRSRKVKEFNVDEFESDLKRFVQRIKLA